MAATRPRVFTVPPSAPFLPTLIAALMEGRLAPGFPALGDPLALASATLYLPTRRACRLARDVFLGIPGCDAVLLPRLVAIGDIDEDELIFAEAAGPLAQSALDLPPPLGGFERQLLLAQLILKWSHTSPDVRSPGHAPLVAGTPAAALALADALGRLIDDMITRGVPWSKLDGLVPDHVDTYWQLTLNFLKVARDLWPALLETHGAMEPTLRRDRLIAAEAERLQARRDGPVIAAGSTASMPATAHLLATIARLPYGAVVLPGLDMHLDEESWALIGGGASADGARIEPSAGHPQFSMHHFLAALGMARDEVMSLAGTAAPSRERLVSAALRPAAATDKWNELRLGADAAAALERVAVIEAANAEEEALAIAVALREAVDNPDATAALVTPDRALARRVIAALARWNVAVDDSGGDALSDTPAGVFARLAAEAALGGLEPVTLLALLKHPLLRLGAGEGAHARAISGLERAVLRGPRPRAGAAGLLVALIALRDGREALHASDSRKWLRDEEVAAAIEVAQRLQAALLPLENIGTVARPLAGFVACHGKVLRALLADDDAATTMPGEDAAAVFDVFDQVAEATAAETLAVVPSDYAEILRTILATRTLRRPAAEGARVRIYGLLEARLQHVDRIVLGGLIEGVWPPQTRSDPWLSRPMRQGLGLDLPERRIGLTAHDFAQALGCREAVLSRADKVGGAPTVPSRFLQRLAAVAGPDAWNAARTRGTMYIELARALDRPAQVRPVRAPEPRPPQALRPLRLSVTEIESWLRDPYTIYAKHILRLRPLDPVDTPPGARDRGSAVHAAIEAFTKQFSDRLPEDPLTELLALGRKHFAPLIDYPEAQAFWWPRFERVAAYFAQWELVRRGNIEAVLPEVQGKIAIPLGERTFELTARADRIERLAENSYALLDYKTGQVATKEQVRSGLSPQLTLEAAMLREGGFTGIPVGARVDAMAYVQLRGGEPPGKECEIGWDDTNPEAEAARAYTRLCELVRRFDDDETPYRSLVHPMWRTRFGDYDHLARVKEWSQTGGEIDPVVAALS